MEVGVKHSIEGSGEAFYSSVIRSQPFGGACAPDL